MDFETVVGGIVIALFAAGVSAVGKAWRSISNLHGITKELKEEIKELKEADKKHEAQFITQRECDLRHKEG